MNGGDGVSIKLSHFFYHSFNKIFLTKSITNTLYILYSACMHVTAKGEAGATKNVKYVKRKKEE